MSNDLTLIVGMRQALKIASIEFCRAFNDLAQTDSALKIRNVLDSQLRLADKLSQLENMYGNNTEEKAVLADIHEYLSKADHKK